MERQYRVLPGSDSSGRSASIGFVVERGRGGQVDPEIAIRTTKALLACLQSDLPDEDVHLVRINEGCMRGFAALSEGRRGCDNSKARGPRKVGQLLTVHRKLNG
jgi:hypothetical protein